MYLFYTPKVPELPHSKNTYLINAGIIHVNTGIFKLKKFKTETRYWYVRHREDLKVPIVIFDNGYSN